MNVSHQIMMKLPIVIVSILAIASSYYYQQETSAQSAEQPQVNTTTQAAASPMVSPNVNYTLLQGGNSNVTANSKAGSGCSAPEGQQFNYLTVDCNNILVNTTDKIDSLQCDKESGWFAVCLWRQQSLENGTSKIFAANSVTGAANWIEPPQLLSNSSTNANEPRLGMSLENAYVVFLQDSGDGLYDAYLTSSNNGGMNWTLPAKNISNSPENVTQPTLTVDEDDGDVLAAWVFGNPGGDPGVGTYCTRC
jgi:hypothetical protein